MKYRCKKAFLIQAFDDDGFEIENKYLEVKESTTWIKDMCGGRITDGEIRLLLDPLTKEDKVAWLEITPERLAEHFEILN